MHYSNNFVVQKASNIITWLVLFIFRLFYELGFKNGRLLIFLVHSYWLLLDKVGGDDWQGFDDSLISIVVTSIDIFLAIGSVFRIIACGLWCFPVKGAIISIALFFVSVLNLFLSV